MNSTRPPNYHIQPAPWLRASISCKKGKERSSMEDRVTCDEFISSTHQMFTFVLLDGHGGTKTVNYVAKHFIPTLKTCFSQQSPASAIDIRRAIKETFASMHEKTKDKADGTTISLLLISECLKTKQRQYWIAHLGDSTIVGVQARKRVQRLTMDHKPNVMSEQKNVKGFSIEDGYLVNQEGDALAMTRCLGDKDFNSVLSREPPIHQIMIPWDVIVLASDGLWDVIKLPHLFELLSKDNGSWEESAYRLNKTRNKLYKQHDNTSVILILIQHDPAAP